MKANYTIKNTPDIWMQQGMPPYLIDYYVDGKIDLDYKGKRVYETEADAHKAGKRYLYKMKKNGFEI